MGKKKVRERGMDGVNLFRCESRLSRCTAVREHVLHGYVLCQQQCAFVLSQKKCSALRRSIDFFQGLKFRILTKETVKSKVQGGLQKLYLPIGRMYIDNWCY
jgi:hypothetical protein